ncbi:MAG: site-specific DNA-methyltransferase [Candidatus Hydrogenedentes bacterium]|nr:site-specific DNA-methyltransferase [Candidatus Hydrogenedentota bacterium]
MKNLGSAELFTIPKEENNIKRNLLDRYIIKDMNEWDNLNADLIITDPPFGIEFSGKNGNYNRNAENVVDGYIEWRVEEYDNKINQLLNVIHKNLNSNGQALIFSGWNNSHIIHRNIKEFRDLILRGKLYWVYNFAPVCRKKPSHNVYEIYWVTKGESWTYNKRCSTHHCENGEPNLCTLIFKRDYKINMPKYPTRLPFDLLRCLLEHFSNENGLIFDPLAGSGMLGIVGYVTNRNFILGDLNENGKLVYEHLIDFYMKNTSLFEELKLGFW